MRMQQDEIARLTETVLCTAWNGWPEALRRIAVRLIVVELIRPDKEKWYEQLRKDYDSVVDDYNSLSRRLSDAREEE